MSDGQVQSTEALILETVMGSNKDIGEIKGTLRSHSKNHTEIFLRLLSLEQTKMGKSDCEKKHTDSKADQSNNNSNKQWIVVTVICAITAACAFAAVIISLYK